MYTKITTTLTEVLSKRPSYFRWSNERIANRFGCKPVTVKRVKKNLETVKNTYEASLKD
jgi:hypothetical protein